MVKTKGDLTAEQEAEIETLIDSFDGKFGKINIDIRNGKTRIHAITSTQNGEKDDCEGLSEEDCIADDTCGTIYRPGNCNGNSTAATCEAEDIYKGCASLAV